MRNGWPTCGAEGYDVVVSEYTGGYWCGADDGTFHAGEGIWGNHHRALVTVIAPRWAGDPPLVVRNASGRRVFRAEIDCGDFSDTVIAALDHSIIKFSDAEIAVIRRARSGDVMDRWTLGGHLLSV